MRGESIEDVAGRISIERGEGASVVRTGDKDAMMQIGRKRKGEMDALLADLKQLGVIQE